MSSCRCWLLHWKYLDGFVGSVLAGGILLSSLFHFSDEDSKTKDNCFVGFPAIWNIVAFFVFALDPPRWLTLPVIAGLIIATFVPMPWVHPLRVVALRPVTLAVTAAATIAAIAVLRSGFPASLFWQCVLIAVALYYVALAIVWWRKSEPDPSA